MSPSIQRKVARVIAILGTAVFVIVAVIFINVLTVASLLELTGLCKDVC
mgnify:CR=1 FL=1